MKHFLLFLLCMTASSASAATFFIGKIIVVIPENRNPQQNTFHPELSGYIQLQGEIQDKTATVYDIDLEDNEQSEIISQLKGRGVKVVCYFSAGTYEDWRSDKDQFPPAALGSNLADWPGEKWLDIRSAAVKSIMAARMDRAAAAGCDAVDPDNVDGYQNSTGFPLTESDQLAYLAWLASSAHSKGLKIGLKNAIGLIQHNNLQQQFDFTINESCYNYNECNLLKPFVAANKWVFILQYDVDNANQYCPSAKSDQYSLAFFNKA